MQTTHSKIDTAPGSPDVGRLAEYLRLRTHDNPAFHPTGLVAWRREEQGGGGGGDGGDGGSGGDGEGDSGDGDGSGEGDGDGDGSGDGEGEGDGDDPQLEAAQREADEAKRQLREERKRRNQAERELKKKRDAERADAGEHEERITELQQENAELKAKLGDGEYGRSVLAIATRLRFKHPELAQRLLPGDLRTNAVDEDYEVDERMIEKALKDLTKQYDDLVKPEGKPQGEVRGDRDQRRGGSEGNGNSAGSDEFNPRGNLRGGLEELMRTGLPE